MIVYLFQTTCNDLKIGAGGARLTAWMLIWVTLKKGQSGHAQVIIQPYGFVGWSIGCTASRSRSVAPAFWSRNISPLLCMFDCLEQDWRHFTPSALAPTYWETSFMTAVLGAKKGGVNTVQGTQLSFFFFLPSAASIQIRALEQFFFSFPLFFSRLLLLATLWKNEEAGAASELVLMGQQGAWLCKASESSFTYVVQ